PGVVGPAVRARRRGRALLLRALEPRLRAGGAPPHGQSDRAHGRRRGRRVTAGELAVLLAAVLCAIGFAAQVLVLARVLQSMRELSDELRSWRKETAPLLDELHQSVDEARDELARFDRLLGSAEAISSQVGSASRVTRAALSAPMIKTVALASGTSRAAS